MLGPAAYTAIGSGVAAILLDKVDALKGWKVGAGHSFLSGLFLSGAAYAIALPFAVPHLPGSLMVWGLGSVVLVPLIQYYVGSTVADKIAEYV